MVVVVVVFVFNKIHNVRKKQKTVTPDKMKDTIKSTSKCV